MRKKTGIMDCPHKEWEGLRRLGMCNSCYQKMYYCTHPEYREKKRQRQKLYGSEYVIARYQNDPEFRERMKAASREHQRKRYAEGRAWSQRYPEKAAAACRRWRLRQKRGQGGHE